MLNLIPSKQNPFCFYNEVLKSVKTPGELLSVHERIKELYENHLVHSNTNNLHHLQPGISNINQAKNLKALYKAKRAMLHKELKLAYSGDDRIFHTCQYCTINQTNELDHFIPKSEFPEFSVHIHNLFPCCSECNRLKNSAWRNDEYYLFLNLYLDRLPQEKYLEIEIVDINADGVPLVSFFINNNSNISPRLLQTIQSHYEKLKLNDRFLNAGNSIISDLIRDINIYKNKVSKEEISEIVLQKCEGEKISYGYNYWQAILKETLIMNKEFCLLYLE